MVIVLDKLQYYKNETSVGFSVEDVKKDGHVEYSFLFQGYFIDEHYTLQEDTKFQRKKALNQGYHTTIFGVAHSQEEARTRLYDKALSQAKDIASKSGQTLDNKVVHEFQTNVNRPSLLKQMIAFTSAESEH